VINLISSFLRTRFLVITALFGVIGTTFFSCSDDESTNTAPTVSSQIFSVVENAAEGTAVGTVAATDVENDDLAFSIIAGNAGDVFGINDTTGLITVKTATTLDFETTPTYTLEVRVSDGKESDTAMITINVTDVSEAALGTRLPAQDINSLTAAGNNSPRGLWSDDTTLWVADIADDKIYAYTLATGARDASKDINTLSAAGNKNPQGLWSDGTTLWVVDDNSFLNEKIYAYTLSDGGRNAGKDINMLTGADNRAPTGLWSDGATLWVADLANAKIYAYTPATGAHDAAKEFDLTADNSNPYGIWSDGTTLWVVDIIDDKIYAYAIGMSL